MGLRVHEPNGKQRPRFIEQRKLVDASTPTCFNPSKPFSIVLFDRNICSEGAFCDQSLDSLSKSSPRPSTTLFPARLSKAPGIKLYRISASLRSDDTLNFW